MITRKTNCNVVMDVQFQGVIHDTVISLVPHIHLDNEVLMASSRAHEELFGLGGRSCDPFIKTSLDSDLAKYYAKWWHVIVFVKNIHGNCNQGKKFESFN